jgi:hypothetical protein
VPVSVMSVLFEQELLGVARVPEVELILGVFKVLKSYTGQSPKYTSSVRSRG